MLVDFWAPWCGPCRMVAPVLEEIANERADPLKVVKLNIDENQQTAIEFNVLSIPTLILFKNGAAGQDRDRRLPEAQARGGARAGARLAAAARPTPAQASATAIIEARRPSIEHRLGGPVERLIADPDRERLRRDVRLALAGGVDQLVVAVERQRDPVRRPRGRRRGARPGPRGRSRAPSPPRAARRRARARARPRASPRARPGSPPAAASRPAGLGASARGPGRRS